jgi:hypothetical protein
MSPTRTLARYSGLSQRELPDEMRTGTYAYVAWWGRYVTIQRNVSGWDPDTFFFWDQ